MAQTKEQSAKLEQEAQDIMKPKLPEGDENGLLVTAAMYDIAYSEGARNNARAAARKNCLIDGFTIRFLYSDYYTGRGKNTNHVNLFKFNEAGDLEFNELVLEGMYIKGWFYCGEFALRNASIKHKNLGSDRKELIAFATLLNIKFGIPLDMAIAYLSSFQKRYGDGEYDPVSEFGEKCAPVEYGTGITTTAFRRRYQRRDKTWDTDYHVFDKTSNARLPATAEWLAPDRALKIFNQVNAWAEENDSDTKFPYGQNKKKDDSLEKEAGF